VTHRFFALALGIACATACAKPAQLGGLGVFNPRGLEGRIAMSNRVNRATSAQDKTSEAAKAPRSGFVNGQQ
jgi:hypothetical protein